MYNPKDNFIPYSDSTIAASASFITISQSIRAKVQSIIIDNAYVQFIIPQRQLYIRHPYSYLRLLEVHHCAGISAQTPLRSHHYTAITAQASLHRNHFAAITAQALLHKPDIVQSLIYYSKRLSHIRQFAES